jgi:enamine deaminase RidA (YjgF/YER057c/UK114 family)
MPTRADVLDRLTTLALELPVPPPPGGAYVPVRVVGTVAWVAIQFPVRNGTRPWAGRLGVELDTEAGYAAAQLCALNVLAQLDRAVGFERLVGLGRFEAYLQASDGWNAYPRVLDGASELFLAALGAEVGTHARVPLGVAHLPNNAPVALAVTAVVRDGSTR